MPHGDEARAVVWRFGDALLAVPLGAVVEVAAVAPDGTAVSRGGRLDLRSPPGLTAPSDCRHAVVVWAAGARVAMAAEAVDGVLAYSEGDAVPAPAWLRSLPTEHIAGLIRLDDLRIAALLAVEALAEG